MSSVSYPVFPLAARCRTGVHGMPGPGSGHENATGAVNPIALHADEADKAIVPIQHRHKIPGSVPGMGKPARGTEVVLERVLRLFLRQSDSEPQNTGA
jgi:hypothetical protein